MLRLNRLRKVQSNPEEEEEAEIVLMHIVRGEDGDTYQPVENEVLLDEVFGRFLELMDELDEEEE